MLVEAIPTVGKNTQQIKGAILKQVKAYVKLLNAFCSSARVEASLIVHLQVRSAGSPTSWQLQDVQEAPWTLLPRACVFGCQPHMRHLLHVGKPYA